MSAQPWDVRVKARHDRVLDRECAVVNAALRDSLDWWIRRAQGQQTRIDQLQVDLTAAEISRDAERKRAEGLIAQIREAWAAGPEEAGWILEEAMAGMPPAEPGEVRDRIRL